MLSQFARNLCSLRFPYKLRRFRGFVIAFVIAAEWVQCSIKSIYLMGYAENDKFFHGKFRSPTERIASIFRRNHLLKRKQRVSAVFSTRKHQIDFSDKVKILFPISSWKRTFAEFKLISNLKRGSGFFFLG